MKTLFKQVNILTMRSEEILWFYDLLVEDGRIAAIGRSLLVDGVHQVIDCAGKFLLPGLFDAHVHLNSSEMGELFIANGVTSVRHLSGGRHPLDFDAQVRIGARVGPYVYSSGPIYDGAAAQDHNASFCYISSEEEAEKAVQDTIEAGFRWVKTYPSIAVEHLKRLMDTACACGIRVCGHMSYFVDSKMLRDWGYHCCEHSSSLPKHDADIEYLAKSGMWFCPTQAVCETLPDYVWNGKKLDDLEYYAYVPKPQRDFWERRNRKIIEGYKQRGLRPDINQVIQRGRKFIEYSNRWMAGSDTAYPGMIPGFSLHDELSKLVHLYGCSPFEALRAATVNPALYIGLEEEKGMIRKGMDADLLLLDRNPLADIRNTASIRAVMQGGKLYDRRDLDSMLDHVRNLTEDEFEFYERME